MRTKSPLGFALMVLVLTGLPVPRPACGGCDPFRAPASFAPVPPGRILIYRNASSEVARSAMTDDLRETLQWVGHVVEVVETPEALERALGSAPYDIVLADVQDAATVERCAHGAAPLMVPVVYRASWLEVIKLKDDYPLVLNAPLQASQAVKLVDQAMSLSRAAANAAGL